MERIEAIRKRPSDTCPACHGIHVASDFEPDVGPWWKCTDCGYQWSYSDEVAHSSLRQQLADARGQLDDLREIIGGMDANQLRLIAKSSAGDSDWAEPVKRLLATADAIDRAKALLEPQEARDAAK